MLVFVHVSKTGGSTITHMLRSSYGTRHCQVEPWHGTWAGPPFSADDLRRLRTIYPDLKSIAGHRVMGYVDLETTPDPTYLTFMRDPVKAAASRFQAKVRTARRRELVFEEWVERDWTCNRHTKQLAGVDDVGRAIRVIEERNIFVGLTERFDESLVMMRGLLANDLNISYEPVNITRDDRLARELLETERTRNLLVESQKLDLELYEYAKRALYPKQRRMYGASLDEDIGRFLKTQDRHFSRWNRTLSRLKHYTIYRPSLSRYRRRAEPR